MECVSTSKSSPESPNSPALLSIRLSKSWQKEEQCAESTKWLHLFSRVFCRHGSGKNSRSNEEEKRNDLHLVAWQWHDLVGSRWLSTTVAMRQDCCDFMRVRPLFRCFLWFDLTVFSLLLLWNRHHHLFLNRIDKINMSPMDNNISRADLSHKY